MITQTVTVTEKGSQNIIIGRRNTYGTEVIVFDLSYLIETFGDGSAILMVKRSTDSTAYPAVTEQIDNRLSWSISDVDTSYKGHGEAELFWYVDDALAKSVIYDITVLRDIGETTDTPPDPYQTWVDTLTDLGAETLENAQSAAQSAEDANTAKVAAETAQGKAETAQEKAETAQGKAETAQGKAEDAQEAAEIAVTHYPKIVNSYWYVWQNGQWVNTGVKAEGSDGREIVSVTCEKTGTSGLVDTYTMTINYNSANPDTVQFLVTNGEDGYSPVVTITTITGGHRVTITDKTHQSGQSFDVTDGIDGVSPEVTITEITGGHRVTITDEDHPLGQSFDVMDGANTDAEHVTYDGTATYSDGTVGKAISALNSAISTKADVIVDSVSSAPIASFPDGADAMPIRELNVTIEPVQDLHGYDNPWPAGGNKNLADSSYSWTVSESGVVTESSSFVTSIAKVEEGETYAHSYGGAGHGMAVYAFYESLPTVGSVSYNNSRSLNSAVTFTAPITGYVVCRDPSGSTNVQIEKGSSVTDFAPYSNLCPISGWTGANGKHSGANLAEVNSQTFLELRGSGGSYSNGAITSGSSASQVGILIPIIPGIQYKIGYKKTAGSSSYRRVYSYSEVPTTYESEYVRALSIASMSTGDFDMQFTAQDDEKYLYIGMYKSSNAAEAFTIEDIYVRVDGVAEYVAPSINPISVSWQTQAGTVYGGQGDVISGEWEDGLIGVDMGSLNWQKSSSGNKFYATVPTPYEWTVDLTLLCSCYKPDGQGNTTYGYYGDNGTIRYFFVWQDSPSRELYVHDEAYSDATTFKNAVTGQYVVYKRATPVPFTTEPVAVNTKYGQNNIWFDCGQTEVTYPCDTKLYLEKLTEPAEDDLIANNAIASGKFFMIGNTLYKATTAIASGATITIGTNATRLSLADALNLINT